MQAQNRFLFINSSLSFSFFNDKQNLNKMLNCTMQLFRETNLALENVALYSILSDHYNFAQEFKHGC